MTYHLDVTTDRTLCWRTRGRHADAEVVFRPLEPLSMPQWPDIGFSQAEFEDGRRIVYDPRGFMHMVDPLRGHEFSVVVVKGNTAAWANYGQHFGERAFLWDEEIGAPTELVATSRRLCRPLPSRASSVPVLPLSSSDSHID
jgi:hypothetical protein